MHRLPPDSPVDTLRRGTPPLERSLAFTARAEQPARHECRIRANSASSLALTECFARASWSWPTLPADRIACGTRAWWLFGNCPSVQSDTRSSSQVFSIEGDLVAVSRTQQLITKLAPQSWATSMEAESRAWTVRCRSCGFGRSIWELGGIRWKAKGSKWTWGRCSNCGKRGWHTISRVDQTESPT